jgi:tetratricopeptide (TPR) repeat protein
VRCKSLEPAQVQALLDNEATRNPLYLKVALEELREFGTFRLLSARINEFKKARTPRRLFAQVIEGLSFDFETDVLLQVLTFTATSRHGMSESELVQLVVGDANGLDDSHKQRRRDEVAAILRHFQAYLHFRGGLLDFLHRSLREAVEETFLKQRSSMRKAHQDLGLYFARVGRKAEPPWRDQGQRSIAEALHHFLEAEDWDAVLRQVNDDMFVFRKGRSPYYKELVQEWSRALVRAPAHYAAAIAVAFARGASQQYALTEIAGGVILQTARLDERRFISLMNCLTQKGEFWRGELLKAQAQLIGIGQIAAAQAVVGLVEASYDGDEPPDDGLAASYQQLAVLRNSTGDHDDGLKYAEKSAKLGRASGDQIRVAIADATRISSLEGLARFSEAAQLTKELFERGKVELGVGRIRPRTILSGFVSLVRSGEANLAESMLRDGLEECHKHSGAEYDFASLAGVLGGHCIERNKPADALPTLRTALGMPASSYPDELRPGLYYLLFLCHAQLDQTNEAVFHTNVTSLSEYSRNRRFFEGE